ncbi:MAG: FMN-binding negative transcriptional regulator [Burkholderiaceae bacterium]
MYQPKHFEAKDASVICELIRANPLATLIVGHGSDIVVNHIPMMLIADNSGPTRLRCHVARANPVWESIGQADTLMAVFGGLQSYISPNWYETKKEHGKVVPTWNYEAVHVRGVATVHDDPVWLREFLDQLTAEHEATEARPWQVSDAPADYIESMLRAIVGIDIAVTQVQAKAKMSQNQPPVNRASVVSGLEKSSEQVALPDTARADRYVMARKIRGDSGQ